MPQDLSTRWRWSTFDRDALAENGKAELSSGDGLELVSLGPPLPGFAVEIRDERSQALPSDYVGDVWVRGPSLMQGYHGLDAETRKVLDEGWLDTGDRGLARW